MMPKFFLRSPSAPGGWREGDDVVDVKVQKGKMIDANNQEQKCDLMSIVLKTNRFSTGQQALSVLVEVDQRLIDFRIENSVGHVSEGTMIVMGDDTMVDPSQHVVHARLMGLRRPGLDPLVKHSRPGDTKVIPN